MSDPLFDWDEVTNEELSEIAALLYLAGYLEASAKFGYKAAPCVEIPENLAPILRDAKQRAGAIYAELFSIHGLRS